MRCPVLTLLRYRAALWYCGRLCCYARGAEGVHGVVPGEEAEEGQKGAHRRPVADTDDDLLLALPPPAQVTVVHTHTPSP
eukprot:719069-Rhodomonas_salina.1